MDLGQIMTNSLPAELQAQMPKTPKTEIISATMLNDSSNIFAHLMLMGFIVSLGYKLANLGIQMLRPIVVKLKAKEETPQS
jgi:hypothetical protein